MSTTDSWSLQDIVDAIKTDSQSGEVGNNNDTVAASILRHFNDERLELWDWNNWDWSKTDINVTVPALSTTPISLAAYVGELISLGIVGNSGELNIFTESEWRRWRKGRDGETGVVNGCVLRGLDASGNLKVLFVPPPSAATSIEGVGKVRLSPVKYSVAQIATVTSFDYFPNEVIPLLKDWAYGRFLRSIKDVRSDAILSGVMNRIERLMGHRTPPMQRATTSPPDYIRWVGSKRSGSTVV